MRTYTDNELADFLREVDKHLQEPTDITIIGGAVLSLVYGSKYSTRDIDYFGHVDGLERAVIEATKASSNPVPVQHAAVADPPYNFETRLERIPISGLSHLQIYRPEKHDLVMMKVVRGQQTDIDAIANLHTLEALDVDILIARWPEMRQAIGNPDTIRNNFLMTISVLFGDEVAEEIDKTLERF